MSDLYQDMVHDAMKAIQDLMSNNDAVRVEILRDLLKVSIAIGWPDDETDDDDQC